MQRLQQGRLLVRPAKLHPLFLAQKTGKRHGRTVRQATHSLWCQAQGPGLAVTGSANPTMPLLCVCVLLQVDSLDEAINLVNSNPYGNGTAIFTDSGSAARRFQHDVQVSCLASTAQRSGHHAL